MVEPESVADLMQSHGGDGVVGIVDVDLAALGEIVLVRVKPDGNSTHKVVVNIGRVVRYSDGVTHSVNRAISKPDIDIRRIRDLYKAQTRCGIPLGQCVADVIEDD